MEKPGHIFDREVEWDHLSRFAQRVGRRAQLGVVSGRRRQGKTYLLQALVQAAGGIYFGATQATAVESLNQFAAALDRYLDNPTPLRFADWDEAIRFVFTAAPLRSALVVIDEYPYLVRAEPALSSIIQRELDRAVAAGAGPSLLLCGSAQSVMGHLLAGEAPLRGRAALELVLRPFDYQTAAQYWGIDDPVVALMTHAVVGGTPAYRDLADGDRPHDRDDFASWVRRTVLRSGVPLFLEARYQLAEEIADQREAGLYHSTLAAVASGNNTRGSIASYVGRKSIDLGHYLNVLEDTGLLVREEDLFRSGRATWRVAEPLITFYEVVSRPRWGLLEAGQAQAAWTDAASAFSAQVLGPHFESVCRQSVWRTARHDSVPGEVGSGVVTDPVRRTQIEVDVVVLAPARPGERRRVLALGEAKWGLVMDHRQVDRLERAAQLLADRGFDVSQTTLECYSGAGFAEDIRARARTERPVRTVSLPDLYAQRPAA